MQCCVAVDLQLWRSACYSVAKHQLLVMSSWKPRMMQWQYDVVSTASVRKQSTVLLKPKP